MCFLSKVFDRFVCHWGLLILLSCYSNSSASEELVSVIALGVGDSKAKACEEALDNARTEAAQQAVTIVESSIGVVENSNGTASYSSTTQTTKAYAKVVSKSEKSKYDPDTGKISCEVDVTFQAGFLLVNNENNQQGNSTNKETVQDFKHGEVFCSKIMGGCFREIYSSQLDLMGIQYVLEDKDMSFMHRFRNSFFNKGYYQYFSVEDNKMVVEEVDFSTKEEFLKFVKNQYDSYEGRVQNRVIRMRVDAYSWSFEKGFKKYTERPNIYSRVYDKIGVSATVPDVDEKYIESLNEQMIETYKSLKEMY